MRTISPARLAAALLFLAVMIPTALRAANAKGMDVLISADAAPSREGFRPKPGKPIHYLLTQTQQTIGDAVAGVKLPKPEAVKNAVVAELAKQGFVLSEVGGPVPDLLILAVVGDANFKPPRAPSSFENPLLDPEFAPYIELVNIRALKQRQPQIFTTRVPETVEALFDPASAFPPADPIIRNAQDAVVTEAMRLMEAGSPRGRDRAKMLTLINAPKIDQAVNDRALSVSEADRIAGIARDNQFYLTLTAFDAKRFLETRERIFLWRTTILIDWREDFTKSLPAMLAQAGPVFGTDTIPGFINTADRREARVDIGTAQTVQEKDAAPAPKK